jgi:outer membrane biosynthesis protein TonB
MERSLFIKWGIAASVLTHVVVLAVILLSTDVRKYQQAAPDEIAVDIVVPDEPEKAPEPQSPDIKPPDVRPPESSPPDIKLPESKPSDPSTSGASDPKPDAKQSAAPPQPAPPTQEPPKPPASREPDPQPQQQTQVQPQPAAPPPAASQGYVPAQPDITVKYGVMLGLPDPLPPLAGTTDNPEDGKDPGPSATTNLDAELVDPLRRHLKSCARLPGSVSRSDNVMVKLRVVLTRDGRLATDPMLIAGTASTKALELKQSAVSALVACQPYSTLPPDRYREWKVLELSFTPQDFSN